MNALDDLEYRVRTASHLLAPVNQRFGLKIDPSYAREYYGQKLVGAYGDAANAVRRAKQPSAPMNALSAADGVAGGAHRGFPGAVGGGGP